MSYEIATFRAGTASMLPAAEPLTTGIYQTVTRFDPSFSEISVLPVAGKQSVAGRLKSPTAKLLRRLHGFFIQEEDDEARVAFVENGQLVHYYLPLDIFVKGGVTVENQPFEVDELETTVDGVTMTGYKVRASLLAKDSRVEPLALDPRSKENLDFVLARVKNAKR